MVSSKSNRNRDGTSSSSSSSSSSMSESTIVLLIAVAMVSFFAGTIFTVHMNMDCVGGGGIRDGGLGEEHHINVKVEELAQKRILGRYIICVDNTAIQFIIEYDAVFCRLETSLFYVKKSKFISR